MAVLASELKYYKSAHLTTDANNTLGGTIESLGGAITATELQTGVMHDLFDAVPSSEATTGRTEYRCIYVRNTNSAQTLYDSKVYISVNTPSTDSNIQLALDPEPVGTDSTFLLADEIDSTAVLGGLTFSDAADFATGLEIGDIPANSYKAVWIRREIDPGAAAAAETCTLALRGDTDA